MTPESNPPATSNVLIVAFHFPPLAGSSGLLRALKLCRYLPEFGWRPTVLTLHPRAYESLDARGDKLVPAGADVIRTFALDTKRHLGFRGMYFNWLALPDRWVSWTLGAVPAGLRAIRSRRIDVIFSTFPVASAVLVGFVLHKLTGKPWVVDLRDSMTEEGYPRDARTRRVWRWLEKKAVSHAARLILTTTSTRHMYLERYPHLPPGKCLLIPNGYDEEDFSSLDLSERRPSTDARPLRLLHTGLIYPEERDPRPFFRALGRLKREGKVTSASLSIAFRASGSEDLYQRIINELEIADMIELQSHVPYHQSLQECADSDGLLLFQAANCDHQVPAKAYEYLRVGRPIFALTTHTGDTAGLLNEVGGATIVNLANEEAIYQGLPVFLAALRSGTHPCPDARKIRRYARRSQVEELATHLSSVKDEVSVPTAQKAESFVR